MNHRSAKPRATPDPLPLFPSLASDTTSSTPCLTNPSPPPSPPTSSGVALNTAPRAIPAWLTSEGFAPLSEATAVPESHFPASEAEVKSANQPSPFVWNKSSGGSFVTLDHETVRGGADDPSAADAPANYLTSSRPKAPMVHSLVSRGLYPSVLMRQTLVDTGRWYYEVTIEETSEDIVMPAAVGWAGPAYFGNAFTFGGVGHDRFSWAYSSSTPQISGKGGALSLASGKADGKEGDASAAKWIPTPSVQHAATKVPSVPCSVAVERFRKWLPGDPCEVRVPGPTVDGEPTSVWRTGWYLYPQEYKHEVALINMGLANGVDTRPDECVEVEQVGRRSGYGGRGS